MKPLLLTLLGLCLGVCLPAQTPTETPERLRTPEELERLLSPIALYPDSLIALILPAASEPSDIVLAARMVAANASQEQINAQPWEESVKTLTRYPTVLAWMDTNLLWTRDVGEAFLVQPADVMNAIQNLRRVARTNGLLFDTPQQRVVLEDDFIYLLPADDNVIYVPSYDPEVLILRRPYFGTFITFGIGFSFGDWLRYDCDWHHRSVWVHHRDQHRDYRPAWLRPDHPDHNRIVGSSWRPDPGHLFSRDSAHRDFVFNRPVYTYGRGPDHRDDRHDGDQNRERGQGRERANPPAMGTPRHDPAPGFTASQPPQPSFLGPQFGRDNDKPNHAPNGGRRDGVADNARFNRPDSSRNGDRHVAPRSDATPPATPAPSVPQRKFAPRDNQEAMNNPGETRIRPIGQPRVDVPRPNSDAPRATPPPPPRSDNGRADRPNRQDSKDRSDDRRDRDR